MWEFIIILGIKHLFIVGVIIYIIFFEDVLEQNYFFLSHIVAIGNRLVTGKLFLVYHHKLHNLVPQFIVRFLGMGVRWCTLRFLGYPVKA